MDTRIVTLETQGATKFREFLASSLIGKIVFTDIVMWQKNKPLTKSPTLPSSPLVTSQSFSLVICTVLHLLILTSTFSACATHRRTKWS